MAHLMDKLVNLIKLREYLEESKRKHRQALIPREAAWQSTGLGVRKVPCATEPGMRKE